MSRHGSAHADQQARPGYILGPVAERIRTIVREEIGGPQGASMLASIEEANIHGVQSAHQPPLPTGASARHHAQPDVRFYVVFGRSWTAVLKRFRPPAQSLLIRRVVRCNPGANRA